MTSPAQTAQRLFQLPSSAFGTPALVNPGQEVGQALLEDEVGGLPRKGTDILMDSLGELAAAQADLAQADEFYDGEVGDQHATQKVKELLAKANIAEIEDFNYARVPVDTIAEKLEIRKVAAAAGDEAQDGVNDAAVEDGGVDDARGTQTEQAKRQIQDRAQEAIEDLRKRNQLDAEEPQLFKKASKHGDCYMLVWPVVAAPEEEQEEAHEGAVPLDLEHQGAIVSVDMLVNTAYTTRAFYDPENTLLMTHVIKSWEWYDEEGNKRRRATLYFKNRIERWVTKVDGNPDKREDWMPFVEEDEDGELLEAWPAPNPYGRIPFFHFRNDRMYGSPEHKPAYGPQRLINKLISAHAVTIDYQSFPQRYALADPKADDPLMNLINADNPEDDDDDPEGDGRSQLRSDPSAVWKLPGYRSVGQFSAADPAVFMAPLDRYIKSMSELTGIPLSRFTGFTTPPSGESRRVESEPLYEKVDNRKTAYGAVLEDAYEFALELLGMTDVQVDVKWKPTIVASGTDDWGIIEKKIAMGVPVLTALTEAGYPEDEVQNWLNDETGADLMRRVALLNSIGTAVQTLGAGVGLGVVSAEQVGGIVAKILGAASEALPDLEEEFALQPVTALAQQQAQLAQRGQQVSEHIATAPPQEKLPDGSTKAPAPRDLPPMPAPPPPVKVGGNRGK